MNILDEYTFKVLEALCRFGVDYLVVGGYAVNIYGYRRTTGDIDLWIRPDNGCREKLIPALKFLGIDEESLEYIQQLDFSTHLMFSDGEEPFKIEFMTYISGLSFEEAFPEKKVIEVDGLQVPFIDFRHLLLNKMATSRLKDKMDVEELQKIQKGKERL